MHKPVDALNVCKIPILGAAGLAIGPALQGSLANFASGILLIIFRPFKVDDFIKVADEEGFVEKIYIFTAQIKTFDNRTVIISNATVASGKILHYTTNEIRRVGLSVGMSCGDNIKNAIDVLAELCASHPKVLGEPVPYVGVVEYVDSSINLTVRPRCKTEDYGDVFFEMNEKMQSALMGKKSLCRFRRGMFACIGRRIKKALLPGPYFSMNGSSFFSGNESGYRIRSIAS